MINWIKISPSSVLPEEGDKILIIAQDKNNNRFIYPCTYKHSKTFKLDARHFGIYEDNVKVTHWAKCPEDFLPKIPLKFMKVEDKPELFEIVSSNPLSLGKQITDIEELYDVRVNHDGYLYSYSGFRVVLSDNNSIMFVIEDNQQCCESFGYISVNDNLEEFIGSTLQKVEVVTGKEYTKSELVIDSLNQANDSHIKIEECVFLVLTTDKGELTFTVYNHHDGYYSPNVAVFVGNKLHLETRI